jgi:hypothetical protein
VKFTPAKNCEFLARTLLAGDAFWRIFDADGSEANFGVHACVWDVAACAFSKAAGDFC